MDVVERFAEALIAVALIVWWPVHAALLLACTLGCMRLVLQPFVEQAGKRVPRRAQIATWTCYAALALLPLSIALLLLMGPTASLVACIADSCLTATGGAIGISLLLDHSTPRTLPKPVPAAVSLAGCELLGLFALIVSPMLL